MPPPHTLKTAEIFPSIQGEGLRQGNPTLFVRLTGCNLRCSFCDTRDAWTEGKDFTVDQVLEKIKKIKTRYPARWVCLTGGEPLLQDIGELVKKLKAENFKVQVETNAIIYRSLPVDWYTISPKPPEYLYRPEYRKKAKEVKLIVTKDLHFEAIQRLREEFPAQILLLLQPQSNRKWSMNLTVRLLKKSLKEGLGNVRLSVQLHKIYGLR